jgi:hypothetical protein
MPPHKDPEKRVWDAYLDWLAANNIVPGKGVRVTEAFRAGYLAAEHALESDAAKVALAQSQLDEGRPVPEHGSGP